MKLLMHPKTLQRLKTSMSLEQSLYEQASSALMGSVLPTMNGFPIQTSELCPEWAPNISPLSDDLNISQAVRDKVNANLAKFGKHVVIYEVNDGPVLTHESFIEDMKHIGIL